MRVLLLSYHFPPDPAQQGQRWAHLCRETAQMGLQWQVITPALSTTRIEAGDLHALRGTVTSHPDVRVHYTPVGWRHQIHKLEHGQPARHPLRLLMDGHDRAQHPDAVAEWVRGAVARGQRIVRQDGIDLIVSAGLPVSAHVAGRNLARLSGLPWIADWDAPWGIAAVPPTPRSPLVRGADARLEQALVREASGVIVTSDALARTYRGFRASNDTTAVITLRNGFSPFEVAKASRFLAGIQRHRIRFTYTGLLDASGRNPLEVLEAFAMYPKLVERAELVLVAPGDHQWLRERINALRLGETVLFLKNLSRAETLALQLSSQALLSFGLDSPYQIPPELAEYVGSGRPVLHVRTNRRDPSLEVLGLVKQFLIAENNRFSIAHALERATRDHWEVGATTPIEHLYWSSLAEQLCLWLESRGALARARVARWQADRAPRTSISRR